MKYQKEFDTRIDVTIALSNFVDTNAFVLSELKRLYVGKCYANSFILSVDEIINRSAATLNPRECGKSASISVRVKCTVRDYAIGEHVVVTVQSSASNNIIGKCKDATCSIIDNNDISKILQKDMQIICKVCDRTYQPNDTRIILEVEFYYPLRNNISYKVKRSDIVALLNGKKPLISMLEAKLEKEKAKMQALLANQNIRVGWEKFQNEIANPASLMKKGLNVVDIDKLIDSKGEIIPKNNTTVALERGTGMSMISNGVVIAPSDGEAINAAQALTAIFIHIIDMYKWIRRMLNITMKQTNQSKIIIKLLIMDRQKMEIHNNKK